MRRRQILDAAKLCFKRVGFHSTPINEIAKEAGISIGLIYKYFASKEAVIEAIIYEDLELQLEQLSELFDAIGDPLDETMERGMEALHRMLTDADRTALMLEVAAEAVRNPKVRQTFAKIQAETSVKLEERLSQMASRTGIDREELSIRVHLISALSQGLATQVAVQAAPINDRMLQDFKRTIRMILLR